MGEKKVDKLAEEKNTDEKSAENGNKKEYILFYILKKSADSSDNAFVESEHNEQHASRKSRGNAADTDDYAFKKDLHFNSESRIWQKTNRSSINFIYVNHSITAMLCQQTKIKNKTP